VLRFNTFVTIGPCFLLHKSLAKITKKSAMISFRIWIIRNGGLGPIGASHMDMYPLTLFFCPKPHSDDDGIAFAVLQRAHIAWTYHGPLHKQYLTLSGSGQV